MTDYPEVSGKEPSKAAQESAKLQYDMFKHITTLSTGTVVVLATFLEKLFKSPVWLPLVIVTFVGMIISLVCALWAMLYMSLHIRESISGKMGKRLVAIVVICFSGFLVAILSLTVFTIRNILV